MHNEFPRGQSASKLSYLGEWNESRENARSREARFACPNRRACSRATPLIHRCAGILEMPGSQAHRERLRVTAPSVNRFRLEKQQLWKCITLFRRFLNRHCSTTTGEILIFTFYGERKHKEGNDFLFPFLNLDMVPKNSTSDRFHYLWQTEPNGMVWGL